MMLRHVEECDDELKDKYDLRVTLLMTREEFDLMFPTSKNMLHGRLDGIVGDEELG